MERSASSSWPAKPLTEKQVRLGAGCKESEAQNFEEPTRVPKDDEKDIEFKWFWGTMAVFLVPECLQKFVLDPAAATKYVKEQKFNRVYLKI